MTTDALAGEFREWPAVRWTKPAGGMYVWMSFPKEVPTGPDSPLMRAAVREGVLYIPGIFGYVAKPFKRFALLSAIEAALTS